MLADIDIEVDDVPYCYRCGSEENLSPACLPYQSLLVCRDCEGSRQHQRLLRGEFVSEDQKADRGN